MNITSSGILRVTNKSFVNVHPVIFTEVDIEIEDEYYYYFCRNSWKGVNTCVDLTYPIGWLGAGCRPGDLGTNSGIWIQVKIRPNGILN